MSLFLITELSLPHHCYLHPLVRELQEGISLKKWRPPNFSSREEASKGKAFSDHQLTFLPSHNHLLQTEGSLEVSDIQLRTSGHRGALTSGVPCCCQGAFFTQSSSSRAGPKKSTEGCQVRVNFHFQFLSPPAGVVSNLHCLTVSK